MTVCRECRQPYCVCTFDPHTETYTPPSNKARHGEPRYWKDYDLKADFTHHRMPDADPVNHPAHYTNHPSGVECITITEHMGFCLGNAVKYIWRADLKGNAVEDLKKAAFYIQREIERREKKAD